MYTLGACVGKVGLFRVGVSIVLGQNGASVDWMLTKGRQDDMTLYMLSYVILVVILSSMDSQIHFTGQKTGALRWWGTYLKSPSEWMVELGR